MRGQSFVLSILYLPLKQNLVTEKTSSSEPLTFEMVSIFDIQFEQALNVFPETRTNGTIPLKEVASLLSNFYRDPLRP